MNLVEKNEFGGGAMEGLDNGGGGESGRATEFLLRTNFNELNRD